ncbi:hypothetical protein CDD82_6711 [Ophiocordyceps australis]|uniref:Rhodopsin domain-containing protein n=1 Tax=Ophiocordyceps australis TaxID=1399860 RepID=A0A2C5XZ69_9HYPO|nr:hypothetical protein CDD82_6711 [Ophiocordyceps australis]
MLVSYTWELVLTLSLFAAKTATLLLFFQIFNVSPTMRAAIRGGIGFNLGISVVNVVMRLASMPDSFVLGAVDPGERRSGVAARWILAQGLMRVVLDVYMFVLPLPLVARLKMPLRKRVQVWAVFCTGFFGVVASIVAIVYLIKVEFSSDSDTTWHMGILVNCNLVEMSVATIIASTPGFALFMRRHVAASKPLSFIRRRLGSAADAKNTPAATRRQDCLHCQRRAQYPTESWALESRNACRHCGNRYSQNVTATMLTTIDVERAS